MAGAEARSASSRHMSRASTSWLHFGKKDVDGRDKPGHDEQTTRQMVAASRRPATLLTGVLYG
jgi:hypothetical protein